MSTDPLVARRLRSQLLAGPRARSVVEVVERLLAVQAQDARGFRLAVRSRSTGLSAADVERALTVDRSVVVDTLNRGTLHLVPAEDHAWLHALTTPQLLTSCSRRLAQEGVSPEAAERGVAAIERALTADGPLDRHALRERLAVAGVPTAGQAFAHLLFLASLRGLVVRGPVVPGGSDARDESGARGGHAFVLTRDWLGALGRPWTGDREAALTRLAHRYLAGHGPAGERDLAKWAGIPLGQARRGLRSLGDRVRGVDGGAGLVELAATEAGGSPTGGPPEPPGPMLLGAFDPLLLGWVDRSAVTGDATTLVTDNGIFRPFALVDGRAVATWGLAGGVVTLRPFEPLADEVAAALATEADAVTTFLG